MNIQINPTFKSLIPALSAEEYAQLEQNIVKDGCREPLILWGDVLIDGHNRFDICTNNEIEFKTVRKEFSDENAAINWMIDNQLGRRNISPQQRDYLIGKRYKGEKKQGERTDLTLGQNVPKSTTAEKIAQQNNVSEKTVKRAEKFADGVDAIAKINLELKEEILSGSSDYTKKEIIEIAKIDVEEEVKKRLEEIEEERKRTKQEKKQKMQDYIEAQKEAIENGIAVLPEGKFEVINIDPPWNYGTKYDPDGRRVANPYPEMSQKELLQLEIPSSEDSVMFLWTTQRFIWDAKELLDNWGFSYRNMIVWDKEKIGMGDLFRMQCEFCIVGIRGKPLFDNDHTNRDIIKESRREHSRKPESFYDMVEKLCVGRKLDYFSRECRQGWEVFGNDTKKY